MLGIIKSKLVTKQLSNIVTEDDEYQTCLIILFLLMTTHMRPYLQHVPVSLLLLGRGRGSASTLRFTTVLICNLPVLPCPLLADETFQSCLQMTQDGTEMKLNYSNWTKTVLDELSWVPNPEKTKVMITKQKCQITLPFQSSVLLGVGLT